MPLEGGILKKYIGITLYFKKIAPLGAIILKIYTKITPLGVILVLFVGIFLIRRYVIVSRAPKGALDTMPLLRIAPKGAILKRGVTINSASG